MSRNSKAIKALKIELDKISGLDGKEEFYGSNIKRILYIWRR